MTSAVAVAVAAEAQPAAAGAPAERPKRLRLSKLAVLALVAAAIAPWLQVLSMEGGGDMLGRAAANNYLVLMSLEAGAVALFVVAIVASLVAVAQVSRRRVRGGALAVGGLLLALGGMAGNIYGPTLPGQPGELLTTMGGGTGHYAWETTAVVFGAAVVCQIVLSLLRSSAPTPEPAAQEQEAATPQA